MKKIILILTILLLSGCFEESGKITKSCFLENNSDILNTKITYTFTFKQDIIEKTVVIEEYRSDEKTIESIKNSIQSQNLFLKDYIDSNVVVDNSLEYVIEYILPSEDKEELSDKFVIKQKRSELVKVLKEKGYKCE